MPTALFYQHLPQALTFRVTQANSVRIGQRGAASGRRVNTLCPGEAGLRDQWVVFRTYHNFVLPHASLRQPLLIPQPTNGRGSTKVWRPWTPAMAAGLTDHVWSLKEVLFYRVPRGHSQQGCEKERAGEGATDGHELMRGWCVRMACVEGVTRAQKAAGRPSFIKLFVPLAVDG